MPVELGQKVRDRITGVEGIATARTEWLYGCTRILVQPQEVKDGKPAEAMYVDEPQCEILGQDFVQDGKDSRATAPPTGRHGAGRQDDTRESPPTR